MMCLIFSHASERMHSFEQIVISFMSTVAFKLLFQTLLKRKGFLSHIAHLPVRFKKNNQTELFFNRLDFAMR